MNYDRTNLPATYDRGRDHGPEVLALWMHALEAYAPPQHVHTILDLGCGTGRFSEALALHFDAEVIGIDPSLKMLEQAVQKQHDTRVQYRHGSAEATGLPDDSVDMVFMSMSFHHFNNRELAARECRRVIRDTGILFVRTGTSERVSSYPYVPFFPSSLPLLQEVMPSQSELRIVFELAGFHYGALDVITQTIASGWEAYANRLEAGGDSILIQLAAEELEQGLSAIREHGAASIEQSITEPVELFIFRP